MMGIDSRREGYGMRSDIFSRGNSMSKDIEAQMYITCSINHKYPWIDMVGYNGWEEMYRGQIIQDFQCHSWNLDSIV